MQKVIRGQVWKFGDDINTDVIYPGKYLAITDPPETAKHAFELVYPDFAKKAKAGDIIVAGKYFGCGSSREQAALCLKYFGIGAIVAESFARIYFRNAINLGLPIVIAPGVSRRVEQGDEVEIDFVEGVVKNQRTGDAIRVNPLPPFIFGILEKGGLIPYLKNKIAAGSLGRR